MSKVATTAISVMTLKWSTLLLSESPQTVHGSYTRRPQKLAAACISTEHPLRPLTVLTAGSIVTATAHLYRFLRFLRPSSLANNPFSRTYPASSNAPISPSKPATRGSIRPCCHPTSALPSCICDVQKRRFGQLIWWSDDTPWQMPQLFLPFSAVLPTSRGWWC
jgi:hypothetical protein